MTVIPEPGYFDAAVDALVPSTNRSGRRGASSLLPRWARRLQSATVGLAFPAVLLLLWELSARYGWLPAQILPDPRLVVDTIQEFVASGELLDDTRISLARSEHQRKDANGRRKPDPAAGGLAAQFVGP